MKTVPVFRIAEDIPADAWALLNAVIAEMNSGSKPGFNRIGLVTHRDSRQQWKQREYVISYDWQTSREFAQKCNGANISAAIESFYPDRPDRHYVDVQDSGLVMVHWHPKDSMLMVPMDKVDRRPLIGPSYQDTGIVPKYVFFVGPNRQMKKAYRRYLNVVHRLSTFSYGLGVTKDFLRVRSSDGQYGVTYMEHFPKIENDEEHYSSMCLQIYAHVVDAFRCFQLRIESEQPFKSVRV